MLYQNSRVFLIPNQECCMRHHEDVLMLDNDPLWYQDAIIYELHVARFTTVMGTGLGTFEGSPKSSTICKT